MKKQIRQQMIQTLTTMEDKQRRNMETKIREKFIQSTLWSGHDMIGMTISHRFEWDTMELITFLWEQGKRVVIPKTDHIHKQLQFYELTNFQELVEGYSGILEPNIHICQQVSKEDVDLLIVPGIVFNEEGYRIGFGGGYYDRFLATFKKTTLSLLSERQLVTHIPVEGHDIPVQYLITEKRVIETV